MNDRESRRATTPATRARRAGGRRRPIPRADRFAFRPRNGLGLVERLEERQLLDGSTDLTSKISDLLKSGKVEGSYTYSDLSLGSFLTIPSVTVSLSNVTEYDDTHWDGEVSIDAASVSLDIVSAFTGSIAGAQGVDGLLGTYTLTDQPLDGGAYSLAAKAVALMVPNVLTANATDVQLVYDPASATGQTLATIGSASATITPLGGSSVSISDLVVRDDGFTLGDATATAGAFNLGGILSATTPSVTFSGVSYTAGSPLEGTITAKADSVSLFANQSGFAGPGGSSTSNGLTLIGFAGSYDLSSNALGLSATGADLAIGKILDAKATGVSIAYDPNAASPVAVDVGSLDATSPLLPGVQGSVTNLVASSAGVSMDDATLTDANPISLGGVFQVTGLTVGIKGFDYVAGAGTGAFAGTIGIGSTSAALFPGESTFTGSVTNFAGSYTLGTNALALSADEVDLVLFTNPLMLSGP